MPTSTTLAVWQRSKNCSQKPRSACTKATSLCTRHCRNSRLGLVYRARNGRRSDLPLSSHLQSIIIGLTARSIQSGSSNSKCCTARVTHLVTSCFTSALNEWCSLETCYSQVRSAEQICQGDLASN